MTSLALLCSGIDEYGRYSPDELKHLQSSFEDLGYEVKSHKIVGPDKIFPRLSDSLEIIVALGLNERKMPDLSSAVFSVLPSIVSGKAPVDYRFVKNNGIYLLQNVNNLPLNATICCYGLKSVCYTIRKMILDQWELTDATKT